MREPEALEAVHPELRTLPTQRGDELLWRGGRAGRSLAPTATLCSLCKIATLERSLSFMIRVRSKCWGGREVEI